MLTWTVYLSNLKTYVFDWNNVPSACPWETRGWETHDAGSGPSFMSHTNISTYCSPAHKDIKTHAHAHRIFGSFASSLTKPWHTTNTQYTLMWKQYCIWCVSINVCIPFSLWWMCNEVAEASIQQFSIYELLTLERRGLNITPSWNNSVSLAPSPAPLSVFHLKASHAKQMVWPEIQAKEEVSGTTILIKSASISCFVMAFFGVCHVFLKLYHKYEATSKKQF